MAKQRARWIEDLSSIDQVDRVQGILARWIEEAIEIILRRNLEISMDREAVEQTESKEIFFVGSRIYRGFYQG